MRRRRSTTSSPEGLMEPRSSALDFPIGGNETLRFGQGPLSIVPLCGSSLRVSRRGQ